ncbi:glycosyltransferase family 4 protein [Maribacter sp. 2307ULW6-5]|uniref:glycosyltransferase family 4 protein n=1 Tax=Maribacter sp. 2307ULW6-5 TaxID=3386275 RepID=UPI0039BD906C
MNIVFLALSYPDVSKGGNLYTDLLDALLQEGHSVFVVAPAEDEISAPELRDERGAQVLRVPTLKLFGGGLIEKGLSNVLLPKQYKRAIKAAKIDMAFDLIIMPTPPITLINVAQWIKKRSKAKLYLILRDIFPQNAVDLKMMSPHGPLYHYFRKLERKLYRNADAMGCMSQENINYVLRHNPSVPKEKLHLLPNWEKFKIQLEDAEKKEFLVKKYGLENKFIAIYGGNMGKPQQLENVLQLAKEVQDVPEIVFLFIGWGTEKAKLQQMALTLQLNNVRFLENLPRPDYNTLLQCADVGLISLHKDFTIPNYPSKVNAYYKLKLPVLATVDVNTDFGRDLEAIGAGLSSAAGDIPSLKSNLLTLYRDADLRKKMGKKGHLHFKNRLTPELAARTIAEQALISVHERP